jgi:hypothetical protein
VCTVAEKLAFADDPKSPPIPETSFDSAGGGAILMATIPGYYGKLTFTCYGPTSKYFSATLSMSGDSDDSVKTKQEGLGTAQHKVNVTRANVDRAVGGSKRGMSLQTKVRFGFMAQHEDEAKQKHHDRLFLMLSKRIEELRKLVEMKMRRADGIVDDNNKKLLLDLVDSMMASLEKLSEELGELGTQKCKSIRLWAGFWSTWLNQWGLAKRL